MLFWVFLLWNFALTIEYLLLKKNNTLPASEIKISTLTSEELASQVDELYDIYNDVAESIRSLKKTDGENSGVTLSTRKVGL